MLRGTLAVIVGLLVTVAVMTQTLDQSTDKNANAFDSKGVGRPGASEPYAASVNETRSA